MTHPPETTAGPVVAVVGSRNFADERRVRNWVAELGRKHPNCVVVSGGARGVDRVAEAAARRARLSVVSFRPYSYRSVDDREEYSIETLADERANHLVGGYRINPPYFRSYGAAAKHRNGWIVDVCDHLIAFWDGSSGGTYDSIRRAEKAGKLARVFPSECEIVALVRAIFDARPVA